MHRVLRFRTKIYSLNLYLDYQASFSVIKIYQSSESNLILRLQNKNLVLDCPSRFFGKFHRTLIYLIYKIEYTIKIKSQANLFDFQ